MGQARRRGAFEQRRDEAIKREEDRMTQLASYHEARPKERSQRQHFSPTFIAFLLAAGYYDMKSFHKYV